MLCRFVSREHGSGHFLIEGAVGGDSAAVAESDVAGSGPLHADSTAAKSNALHFLLIVETFDPQACCCKPPAALVARAGGTLSSDSCRSGCIRNASTAPASIKAMVPMNGHVHWPVLSTIKPNTTGETIVANADPVLIMPLAVPEYFGAMSIGMAHIGPIVNSAKKKPALSATVTILMSVVNRTGTNEMQHSVIMMATRFRRAMLRFLSV
jgi:hypothetical protein